MASLTVRSIPAALLDHIRALAVVDRRSLNSEVLVLLERSLETERGSPPGRGTAPDAATQLGLWEHLCGAWQDERSAAEISADIRARRTPGRAVDL
jgi:plasmid stability protein